MMRMIGERKSGLLYVRCREPSTAKVVDICQWRDVWSLDYVTYCMRLDAPKGLSKIIDEDFREQDVL